MSLPNAFVTLLTTPSYLPGALVLLHSLLELHPAPRDFQIVALVTPETVDPKSIGQLREAGYDLVIGVEPIGSGKAGQAGLELMGRPDLNFALTKLHLFRLQSLFSTLIYLDADVLPLRPLSHLFSTTKPHVISACPDTGWPDCFNSGVMVIRPRDSDWHGLRALLRDGEGEDGVYREAADGNGSFDGADQGLLNEWFSEEGGGGDWHRLPFIYNVTPSAAYTWAPAYRRYGHKISNVHFIGPNKPWSNLAGRPAGMSNVKGKEASYDYPALLDRWYHIYDKHVRPTAAHQPDVSRRFAVPETVAVWNQSGAAAGVPHQPSDRLNLSELRAAASQGFNSFKSGQYTSLPLEGRVDLLMPKPAVKTALAVSSTPPKSPSAIASPTIINAPPPQTLQQQTERPATWDASRYSPPVHGQPEMKIPMNTHYQPAWEQPTRQQGSYFHNQQSQAEPQYPTLPENVKKDDWYKQYHGKVPDRTNVHAVFPWEERGHRRPAAGRVFPRGDSPPPEGPSINVQIATPDVVSPRPPSPQRSPSPPSSQPRSMAEAMASYTNAWDSVPQIGKYVKRLSNLGMAKDIRQIQTHNLKSVPGTPRGGSIDFTERRSTGALTDNSADGDDEGDSTDDEEGPDESPVVGYTQSSTFPAQPTFQEGQYPSHTQYRDRFAQTEQPEQSDAKVQAFPGGVSPEVRNVSLPSSSTRSTGTAPSQGHSQTHGHARRPSKVNSSSFEGSRQQYASRVPAQQADTNTSTQHHAAPLPDYTFHKGSAAEHKFAEGPKQGGRVWDPSTDVEQRRKDTQHVLSRFMKAGGFGK